jgi:hypothetical protein
LGDVVCDFEVAVCAPSFGVHHALGDSLAIEMRELLYQMMILEEYRTGRARGPRMLVVDHRRTAFGGKSLFIVHWVTSLG